ncbi:hypothetical protein F2Q70_00011770 [Brassica cretica]|uniref:Uncharacterized protein n=1 Tax=Brassica cretica TaxID=69181 RepID=A0A8S9M9N6_BRACR|nr:hypothetical protein F2Q70_00011770 [Brassica cretica]
MQVVQTGDTVKRQEALAREARVEKAKHHVNAIIDDDFWQVVKHEKLDHDEDRSTDYSNHRSTLSAKSTAECSAVRIMTHEEFAEKHPHPPSPFYVKIDRWHEPAVDRQRETDIDRPPSPPIDRRTPLTYRVRLPSIDSDQINALRPPPKPLANPPEPITNPSDTTPVPMKDDEATEGRRLRKRKEKIPKNLKREANEKEMDGFTKRVLKIPVEKPFDEVYYTHWERMKLRITLKKKSDPRKFAIPCVVKGIEFPHAPCDTGASVNLVELGNDLGYIAACHCGAEYETEYSSSEIPQVYALRKLSKQITDIAVHAELDYEMSTRSLPSTPI